MLKIAVVNDSPIAVESLRRVIESVAEYKLIWVAYNGREAVQRCSERCPDIILMDLIMPEMDGVEATRKISADFDCAILVVTAIVDGYAGKVFEAMGAGALDAVNTPVLGESGQGEGRDSLIRKIDTIAMLLHGKPYRRRRPDQAVMHPQPAIGDGVPLIAIGASTGGPSALREVLQALPPDPGVAIAIIQHVDEQFSASFIAWLDEFAPLPVRQARPGDRFEPGTALVCGREDHLVFTAGGSLDYSPEPRELAYRPSVDVFFNSLAEHHENQTVGVLLTGMGKDGAAGLKAMRERGWLTLTQDKETCAVYGMPKAAKELDAATEILPLGNIGPRLAEWTEQASSRGKQKLTSG
ncbi:MAG: Wsp signal transduction system protein-glutamate methylesterase WspF [Gammaproteobacteria bacterium]|nr:MAG: Wsp signal transduction system protein-glutamate methylesterase WspF [Gammaproteobacteria bacterium]